MARADSQTNQLPLFSPSAITQQDIDAVWQTGNFDSFIGVDNKRINYAGFNSINNKDCILLVPGRSEGYLKYQELTYNLVTNGFNLIIIDHRGQGMSERLTENLNKGHVHHFDDYVDDLAALINNVLPAYCRNKSYLLAHSMGGAISARYFQKFPTNAFSAAVLSSPMLGINSGGIPHWLAKVLINTGTMLNHFIAKEPWYFFGQNDYATTAFNDNVLTHSPERYQAFITLYQENTQLQLGGVTFQWLAESIRATEQILDEPTTTKTPILVLQAANDTVVDNEAQNKYCQRLSQYNALSCPKGKPIIIDGAKHELLFEQDSMRSHAINEILAWFNKF